MGRFPHHLCPCVGGRRRPRSHHRDRLAVRTTAPANGSARSTAMSRGTTSCAPRPSHAVALACMPTPHTIQGCSREPNTQSPPPRRSLSSPDRAFAGAGCSNAPATPGGDSGDGNTAHAQAVQFAQCMRDNGVKDFPDPDATGTLTIEDVANGTAIDTNWRGVPARHHRVQGPGSPLGSRGLRGRPTNSWRPSSSPSAFATTECGTFRTRPLMSR